MHDINLSGLAHRDLKLDNILLDNEFGAKVADLGFARHIQGDNQDGLLNTNLGTPGY